MSDVTIELNADDRASADIDNVRRKVSQLDNDLGDVGSNTTRATGSMGGFRTALEAVAGVLTIDFMMNLASTITEVGGAANRAESSFRTLLGTTTTYDAAIEQLRDRTRGLVDDTTLMQGASRLMGMGLADTQNEVTELLGMAVDLGAAFGTDASTAISDFAAMLANQSVERLDTFGISSGQVRDRINELLASGQALNREDAFTMATLEIGRESLERLAPAIAENTSQIGQLGTRFSNVGQDVAQGGADILEGAAGTVNAVAGIIEANATIAEMAQERAAQAVSQSRQIAAEFEDINASAFGEVGGDSSFFEALARGAQAFQDAMGRTPQTIAEVEQGMQMFLGMSTYSFSEAGEAAADFYLGWQNNAEQAAARTQSLITLTQEYASTYSNMGDVLSEQSFAIAAFAEQTETAVSSVAGIQEILGSGSDIGGVGIFTVDDADRARSFADEAARAVEQAALLRDQGLLGDEQVERLQNAANEADRLAQMAERGRDAFADMSLDQLLGVTDGGALGDLTDEILAQAQNSGLDESQIAELRAALDEQSGRTTEQSVALMSEQIPDILATFQEQGAQAATDLALGVLNEVASTAAGLPVEWTEDGFTAVQDNIVTPMMEAQASAEAISTSMAELTATPQVVEVRLNVNAGDMDALAQALLPFIERGVRGAGGAPIGEDRRQTSGRSTPR